MERHPRQPHQGQDHTIEDEIRHEMEREAHLQKVKAKLLLAQKSGGSKDSGE
jgi:hypothetical protein